MKDLIEYIARNLVDEPDQVRVESIEGPRGPVLKLHVAEGDLGRVIGREGRIATAIRTLVSVGTGKKRYRLDIG
jgi:hypothetical protein